MKTRRTISNVSYNTLAYFVAVVQNLVDRGIIEWCYWICHKAEDDELKDHIHFVLQPSASLETKALAKLFMELDPTNPKPLGVTSKWMFTSSMDDWILYSSHDAGYLLSKGQVRKYHYEYKDFGSTDPDAFREDWNRVNRVAYSRLEVLASAVEEGTPFVALVQNGIIPIAQRAQYQMQYNELRRMLMESMTGRNTSHEQDMIHETIPDEFKQMTEEEAEQISFETPDLIK